MFSYKISDIFLSHQDVDVPLREGDVFEFARFVAQNLHPSDWILLEGDLGAGKTFFVSELLRAMGREGGAESPTFPIVNVIQMQNVYNGISKICHLDLYRLKASDELLQLGLELEVTNQSLVLLEWPENLTSDGWEKFFAWTRCKKPNRAISVYIERSQSPDERIYKLRLLKSPEWWRDFN
ncbi:MAG: hypothetical protein RIR26_2577 [Pseudomonadota bacterium]